MWGCRATFSQYHIIRQRRNGCRWWDCQEIQSMYKTLVIKSSYSYYLVPIINNNWIANFKCDWKKFIDLKCRITGQLFYSTNYVRELSLRSKSMYILEMTRRSFVLVWYAEVCFIFPFKIETITISLVIGRRSGSPKLGEAVASCMNYWGGFPTKYPQLLYSRLLLGSDQPSAGTIV